MVLVKGCTKRRWRARKASRTKLLHNEIEATAARIKLSEVVPGPAITPNASPVLWWVLIRKSSQPLPRVDQECGQLRKAGTASVLRDISGDGCQAIFKIEYVCHTHRMGKEGEHGRVVR